MKRYKTIFQIRRGTDEQWSRINPILRVGEPGYVTDTARLKIGDGITPWNDLPFNDSSEEIKTLLEDKVDKEDGKGLSSNDFTDEYKAKLDSASPAAGQIICNSYEEAINYAKTNPNARIGQIITVVDTARDLVTVYIIANSNMDIEAVGSSSSVNDYNRLQNKPKINGVTLLGNKTSEDLDMDTASITNTDIEALFN